jgi:tRNA A37 N6-isopentenylltransferase MiaA
MGTKTKSAVALWKSSTAEEGMNMSSLASSLLSIYAPDELSAFGQAIDEVDPETAGRIARHNAEVTCRILNLFNRQQQPSARLSDREREQVDLATLDSIGLDLCASLDDCDDAAIGRMLRTEHERRVMEKLSQR